MFRCERVERSSEHQLRQQQLVSTADLARHTALHLDDVIAGSEAQSPQNPLARFKLLELQDIVDRANLTLERLDVLNCLQLSVVCVVEGRKFGVFSDWQRVELVLEKLDLLRLLAPIRRQMSVTHLDQVHERLVSDAHVLDRVQQGRSARHPPHHLAQSSIYRVLVTL